MNMITANSFVYQQPAKKLVDFSLIPLASVTIIKDVIISDEGGWVLTKTAGDNDGGWTYGGMTSRKFSEYFPGVTATNVATVVSSQMSAEKQLFHELILRIYYQDYLMAAAKAINFSENMTRAYFSCILNVGSGGFSKILADRKSGKSFTTAWKDYYFNLTRQDESKMQFLRGWINRVWRYVLAN